jgi:hypothetical protein
MKNIFDHEDEDEKLRNFNEAEDVSDVINSL